MQAPDGHLFDDTHPDATLVMDLLDRGLPWSQEERRTALRAIARMEPIELAPNDDGQFGLPVPTSARGDAAVMIWLGFLSAVLLRIILLN